MKQRLWFIAALIAAAFTAYTLTTHAQTGGALHPYVYGSLVASGDLTLISTFNATKGSIFLGAAQNSAYDEVNDRLGIGTTSPAAGLHGVVTNGSLLWAQSEADDAVKSGTWGVEHYDIDEEPFYGVWHYAQAATNNLNLGGGTGIGNAATQISFWTAANTTTTTGTERVRIDGGGQLLVYATGVGLGFLGDEDSGLQWESADSYSLRTAGNAIFTLTASDMTMNQPLIMVGASLNDRYVEFVETSTGDPTAPAGNRVRVYARDTGGKTELVARFNTGAIQRLAIEP